MEMHLAVGERADELTVLADVRDQHRELGVLDLRGFVAGLRRPSALLQHPEMPREADLLLLGQCLAAEHDDEMFMPDREDVGDRLRRQLVPKIDAQNFGTERRRQWIYDEGGGIDERHGNSAVSSSNLAKT